MASFLVGILNANAQAIEINVVCVVVGPIVGYDSSNNGVNGLELKLHNDDSLPNQEELLETMKKQLVWWKPHQRTSPTWAFFKVNNNQHVDLKQSQVM